MLAGPFLLSANASVRAIAINAKIATNENSGIGAVGMGVKVGSARGEVVGVCVGPGSEPGKSLGAGVDLDVSSVIEMPYCVVKPALSIYWT